MRPFRGALIPVDNGNGTQPLDMYVAVHTPDQCRTIYSGFDPVTASELVGWFTQRYGHRPHVECSAAVAAALRAQRQAAYSDRANAQGAAVSDG